MNKLTINDLEYLAIGSAVLGSGGGGNPAYDYLIARHAMEQHGLVQLIDVNTLTSKDVVLPIAFMGAPLVVMEKLPSGRELTQLIEMVERTLDCRVAALLPAEIGGSNAFAPLAVAAKLGLPVVDGDTLGRAFPQLQMSSCHLMKVSTAPSYLADSLGNVVMIHANDAHSLEKIARQVTVAMGSSCAIAIYLMDGEQAQQAIIPGTISQAIEIGRSIVQTTEAGQDPIGALIAMTDGVYLGKGMISEVQQSIKEGFLEGSVTISTSHGNIEILYQNEYLIARKENSVLASTPDIIVLLESKSGTPLTSETLRYGLQVSLVVLPAPAIWQTKEGLQLVGPQCFGYPMEYQPISNHKELI
ncbi:MAG: DUF917 domain-containing protein [Simkania sp.]|nr:DUF917 domain-containing protein [Simkania sp.]